MNLNELLQQLDADAVIEVFEVDTTVIGGVDHFYFHDGLSAGLLPVVWKGVTYQPYAIEADGFELSLKGSLPRPRMKVANTSGAISAVVVAFEDLIGAKVTRRRTFARYLDGQPGADTSQELPDDVYYVERKVNENQVFVEFELASALDLDGVQLPARQIIANGCSSAYRSAECSYAGSNYWDANDNVVGTLALDTCSKTVVGCKLRFGVHGVLPFGGFPAARTYKV